MGRIPWNYQLDIFSMDSISEDFCFIGLGLYTEGSLHEFHVCAQCFQFERLFGALTEFSDESMRLYLLVKLYICIYIYIICLYIYIYLSKYRNTYINPCFHHRLKRHTHVSYCSFSICHSIPMVSHSTPMSDG